MELISGLGRRDPLHNVSTAHHPAAVSAQLSGDDNHDDCTDEHHHGADNAASAGQPWSVLSERLCGLQWQRVELRGWRRRQLSDDNHDAATCQTITCRAHWVDVTREHYDPRTGSLTA